MGARDGHLPRRLPPRRRAARGRPPQHPAPRDRGRGGEGPERLRRPRARVLPPAPDARGPAHPLPAPPGARLPHGRAHGPGRRHPGDGGQRPRPRPPLPLREPRVRPLAVGDQHAVRRCDDGRRRGAPPEARDQGDRRDARPRRDLHRQADRERRDVRLPPPRLGLGRGPERLRRPEGRAGPLRAGPVVHGRRPRPRARDDRDLRAHGQRLQALRRPGAGAVLRRLGHRQPLGLRAHPRRAGQGRPPRVAARRRERERLPRLGRAHLRRRGRRRAQARPGPADRARLRAAGRARDRARSRSARRSTRSRPTRSRARRSASSSSRPSRPSSATSGGGSSSPSPTGSCASTRTLSSGTDLRLRGPARGGARSSRSTTRSRASSGPATTRSSGKAI